MFGISSSVLRREWIFSLTKTHTPPWLSARTFISANFKSSVCFDLTHSGYGKTQNIKISKFKTSEVNFIRNTLYIRQWAIEKKFVMREHSREPESFCKVPGPGLSLISPACINKSDRKQLIQILSGALYI